MFLIKIILFIWPFVKEMLIGNKATLKNVANKSKSIIIISLISFSLLVNIFSVHKLLKIANSKDNKVVCKTVSTISEVKNKSETDYTVVTKEFENLNKKEEVMCPKYLLDPLPEIPNLPIEEINKIDPKDINRLNTIEKSYIITLHNYASNLRNLIMIHYSEYLATCYRGTK